MMINPARGCGTRAVTGHARSALCTLAATLFRALFRVGTHPPVQPRVVPQRARCGTTLGLLPQPHWGWPALMTPANSACGGGQVGAHERDAESKAAKNQQRGHEQHRDASDVANGEP